MAGTLLVIDDSAKVRAELIAILGAGPDFNAFIEAADGAAGLKLLTERGRDIDVVACDLNMPKMDGFQFLRMVKARDSLAGIPIVMVTAASDVTEVVKAFELGANDFIVKPFQPAILKSRMTNMLQIKKLQDELLRQKDSMEQMATTDPLTAIYNVRYFRSSLEDEFNRAMRYGDCLSLLLADLDRFKSINDNFGHPTGDAVLREIAAILVEVMRKVDLVARYGGEEFVAIMPHTDAEGARMAAERLRQAVENHHFRGLEKPGQLTISIGVSTLTRGREMTTDDLIAEADAALYAAKQNGRNRVEIAEASVEYMDKSACD